MTLRTLTIGATARQTGVPAGTLRKWEARYGFPVPIRNAEGQRQFRKEDLEALERIARRIAAGERTGQAIASVLKGHVQDGPSDLQRAQRLPEAAAQALELLQQNDLAALDQCLESALLRLGATAFCRDVAMVLMETVGACWQLGELPVFAEHAFSSTLQSLLARHVPRHKPVRRSCDLCVLLASPAREMHSLALSLFQAMLSDTGVASVFLVGGLPAKEIAAAAIAYRAQVVALSASAVCPAKTLQCELVLLRSLLAPSIALWVGGAGTGRIPGEIAGVHMMDSLEAGVNQLKAMAQSKAGNRGTVEDRKHD